MQTYDIISFATWLRSYEEQAAQRYARMTVKRLDWVLTKKQIRK